MASHVPRSINRQRRRGQTADSNTSPATLPRANESTPGLTNQRPNDGISIPNLAAGLFRYMKDSGFTVIPPETAQTGTPNQIMPIQLPATETVYSLGLTESFPSGSGLGISQTQASTRVILAASGSANSPPVDPSLFPSTTATLGHTAHGLTSFPPENAIDSQQQTTRISQTPRDQRFPQFDSYNTVLYSVAIETLPKDYHSITRPLDMFVDSKLKSKIFANEFIHLALLLKRSPQDHEPLVLCQSSRSSPIKTIEQWLSAFHIFVSIYVQTHPTSTAGLMNYADIIQTLHRRSGFAAAVHCDRNFRMWHQLYPSPPWHITHSEFYMEATAIGLKALCPQQPFLAQNPNTRGKRVCWAYEKHGRCFKGSRCKFFHGCGTCGGKHQQRACSSTSQSGSKLDAQQHANAGSSQSASQQANNPTNNRQQRRPIQK